MTQNTTQDAPVRFVCCDGETRITAKIRNMERYINRSAKYWEDREAFRKWAEHTMGNLLRTLREQIFAVD